MASEKLVKMSEEVDKLSVLELAEWVKILEEKFGVKANMPIMAVPLAGAVAGASVAAEEKSTFSVVLTSVGASKIAVIKEVRTITNLGLKEAKDLVDAAPKSLKDGATKEEAEEIKKKLEAVGATVELK